LQTGLVEVLFHFCDSQLEEVVVDCIRLGDGHHTRLYPKHLDGREVLRGLGHPTLIGSDHEQAHRHPPCPCEHVLDEALMARHIDNAHFTPRGKGQPGKAEIDCQPSSLFLLETVGIDAGQGLNQRRFSVIDMSGGAYYMHFERLQSGGQKV
jgi:hypothetical protein